MLNVLFQRRQLLIAASYLASTCLVAVHGAIAVSAADGFFTLSKTQSRWHLVTPNGRPYLALGINHLNALSQPSDGGLRVNGPSEWNTFWERTLKPQFEQWNVTTLGYGVPEVLQSKAPWFGTLTLASIEKHRSDPRPTSPNGYQFPDVFDPQWEAAITKLIHENVSRFREHPFLIGWFWTDTPTWDLQRTRGLRGTDWVTAIRRLPADAPGRNAYAAFLRDRYANKLDELTEIYSLEVASLDELPTADLSEIAIGRHRVQEDDEAFLAAIARQFYEVVGKAQRAADPNHLVFGDRYLAGDAPETVLAAAAPWIDAVAVQPGDRYSPLYPPSTDYPAAEIEQLYQVTGKPVLICDHAISFPTEQAPLTIFEQMPNEAAAAEATAHFLESAFAKPYVIGYLRCQYIDRPAGFGRGLRQGLVREDGTPRSPLVDVYREGFANALKRIQ